MSLVAGVRCSFRGKDAGSPRAGSPWATADAASERAARPGGSADISPNPPNYAQGSWSQYEGRARRDGSNRM